MHLSSLWRRRAPLSPAPSLRTRTAPEIPLDTERSILVCYSCFVSEARFYSIFSLYCDAIGLVPFENAPPVGTEGNPDFPGLPIVFGPDVQAIFFTCPPNSGDQADLPRGMLSVVCLSSKPLFGQLSSQSCIAYSTPSISIYCRLYRTYQHRSMCHGDRCLCGPSLSIRNCAMQSVLHSQPPKPTTVCTHGRRNTLLYGRVCV